MITIDANEDEVRVVIPRDDLSPEQLETVLRPLRFAGWVAGSRMTKEEATRLAEESKADWWETNRRRVSPSGE